MDRRLHRAGTVAVRQLSPERKEFILLLTPVWDSNKLFDAARSYLIINMITRLLFAWHSLISTLVLLLTGVAKGLGAEQLEQNSAGLVIVAPQAFHAALKDFVAHK